MNENKDLLSCGNHKLVSHSHDLASHSNDLLSCGNDFPVNIFGFCKCLQGNVWQWLKNDGYENHLY